MYAFFNMSLFLLKTGPIGRPGLQGPPGAQGGKGPKGEQVWHLCIAFYRDCISIQVCMATPTYIAVKLVTRPVENGIESNPLFSVFRKTLKQNCTSKDRTVTRIKHIGIKTLSG